jgi:UDPglucose 6-dehydrogenase
MKITVFWTWYVGLVTGTCLAEVWHEVMCIDIDQKKVDDLKKWIIPIYEPGLEELVVRNHKEWRLIFSTDAKAWVEFATAIFSAVGTPPDENHKADLRFVKAVTTTVAENMTDYKVFINKSTVPVTTGDMCKQLMSEILQKRGVNIELDIVSNPEFLKEWCAVKDFMVPDRIVCWIESERAKGVMSDIYRSFTRTDKPLMFTDIKSSEIIKYAANSFLATKISFINEIANFAEIVWANVWDISRWIGLDPRIGSKFLHAGIWYGWSCFPKDVSALIETWKEYGVDFQIIKATESVNAIQKTKPVEKLLEAFYPHCSSYTLQTTSPWFQEEEIKDLLSGKTIAIWGLAFKPKTDDIRDAPSIDVINKLLSLWVDKVQAFDPVAMSNMSREFENEAKVLFTARNYDALKSADALIVLTEWDEFRNPDFDKISDLMVGDIIIDWRNIWNKQSMLKKWFNYIWIGK